MRKILSLLLTFSLSACSSDLNFSDFENFSNNSNSQVTLLSSKNKLKSKSVEKFKSDVSKFGIKLTDDQLRTISIQNNIKPSGKFASRPAHNLSAEQNLEIHFKKHHKEFVGIDTKEKYLQRAISFLNNNSLTAKRYFDTESFAKSYQSNVVKYDSKTFELSAMRNDGDITTYYISKKLSPTRFVEVPPDFVFE